jgi:sugar phosphate isomerase/epimerase
MIAIGVQLYTLRKPFAADPKGTLSRIRQIGYDAVEFAAPLSMDFADLGAHLAAIGLDCPSVHAGIDDMRDRPDAVLAMARHLGCRWIVLPFVMPDQRDWDRVIADLNAFARTATDAGFRVAYHHHDFEFASDPDGRRPFDRLVAGLDPALVSFELDVYWLTRGGEDALALFRKEPGRFHAVLSDTTMPGLAGPELVRELLKIDPHLPVILTTGHSALVSRERAWRLGALEYLVKPFRMDVLAAALNRLLKGRRDSCATGGGQ